MPRGLVPTPEGDRLFALVQPFVKAMGSGLADIQVARQQPGGLLRVGAPVEFGENILPAVMAAYRQTVPEVRFLLTLGHPEVLLPAVRQGDLDLAFADVFSGEKQLYLDTSGLSFSAVASETLSLVSSAACFQQNLAPPITRSALEKCAFIAYQPTRPALKSWFRHHFGTTAVALKVVLTVESVQAMITAIKNHMGFGVVPEHLVQKGLQDGTLAAVPGTRGDLTNRIALVQLADKVPGVTEKSFIRFFKQQWRSSPGAAAPADTQPGEAGL